MVKILFDANVLLDFFLERDKTQDEINDLFSLVDQGVVTGLITTPTFQICAYHLTNSKGVDIAKAVLEMMIMNLQLLEGDRKTIIKALKSPRRKDIEDAIQYFIALENEMDAIVTSDLEFIKLSSPSLPIRYIALPIYCGRSMFKTVVESWLCLRLYLLPFHNLENSEHAMFTIACSRSAIPPSSVFRLQLVSLLFILGSIISIPSTRYSR